MIAKAIVVAFCGHMPTTTTAATTSKNQKTTATTTSSALNLQTLPTHKRLYLCFIIYVLPFPHVRYVFYPIFVVFILFFFKYVAFFFNLKKHMLCIL